MNNFLVSVALSLDPIHMITQLKQLQKARKEVYLQKIIYDTDMILKELPEGALKDATKKRVSENPLSIGKITEISPTYVDWLGITRENDCSYKAFYYITALLPMNSLHFQFTREATDDKILHETCHFMHHMMLGDTYDPIFKTAAGSGHGFGKLQTRKRLCDDYVYFMRIMLNKEEVMWTAMLYNPDNDSKFQTPHDVDFPSVEGFACRLMSCCTTGVTIRDGKIQDFTKDFNTIPLMDVTPKELLAWEYPKVDDSVEGLLNNLRTYAEMKGNAGAMTVIAERCGWSYRGSGKVLYRGTTEPVPGVEVINQCTVNGNDYGASGTISSNDGTYILSRVFPGTSQLKYKTPDGLKYQAITTDEKEATTKVLNLPTIYIDKASTPATVYAGPYDVDVAPYGSNWPAVNVRYQGKGKVTGPGATLYGHSELSVSYPFGVAFWDNGPFGVDEIDITTAEGDLNLSYDASATFADGSSAVSFTRKNKAYTITISEKNTKFVLFDVNGNPVTNAPNSLKELTGTTAKFDYTVPVSSIGQAIKYRIGLLLTMDATIEDYGTSSWQKSYIIQEVRVFKK